MDQGKLFRVLVIGGAMLGAGCVPEPTPAVSDAARHDDTAVAAHDAGEVADASADEDAGEANEDAGEASEDAATADAGEPVNCGICPNEECCVTDERGTHERDGMMCCWSSSC